MTTNEKIAVWASGVGLVVAIAIGLIVATTLRLSDRQGMNVATTPPRVEAKMGNVSVSINDQTSQEPPVLTTEQVADQLEVNADTVRRREASGGLVGYAKRGRNTWVRVGPESGT